MYHEEKVIDNVLCHRSTPDGEWQPYTAQQVTTKYTLLLQKIARQRNSLEEIKSTVEDAL